MTDRIVVLSACATEREAEAIARRLVEKRLAACVNLIPRVRSIYRWQDRIEDAKETMLVIKSTRGLFADLSKELSAMHSYQVPEIIALPIVEGSDSYLDWIGRETRQERVDESR